MSLVLFVSVILVGSPLGRAFVLQSEEPAVVQSSPIIRTSRCQTKSLQSIRKIIVDSLGLQTEPHVSVPRIGVIRDQWKVTFKGISLYEATQVNDSESRTSSEYSSLGNSTAVQCCKLASQIFIKDLGWDKWIIYPDSFTYIQCSGCDPQVDLSIFLCSGNSPPSSQVPCCEPIVRSLVPFLYLDETSSLIMATVTLTRDCGCRPGTGSQSPKP